VHPSTRVIPRKGGGDGQAMQVEIMASQRSVGKHKDSSPMVRGKKEGEKRRVSFEQWRGGARKRNWG